MPSARHLVALPLFILALSTVSADEWTRFRGPNGAGVSDCKTIPVKWSSSDINWKIAIPGEGHSSPVVWQDKVFLFSADPDSAERYLLCISTHDGAVAWRRDFPSQPHHLHTRSSYASCTPAVDAERVYVAWSTPEQTTLMALDHGGEEVWTKDLGTWTSQHGFGTSPMLFEDLVILSNSQQGERLKPGQKPGQSHVMAFDKKTGELRWKTPRVSVNVCYSVPFIYQPQGEEPQLICYNTGNGFYSLDPRTGKELWSKQAFSKRTVNSPIAASGLVFGSTGSGGGGNYVVAVKPAPSPEIAYEIKTAAPYVPCMVSDGELVFLWYDKGIVTCIEAADGKVHWRERIGGNFSGSPVLVDGKIYCISDDGAVFVLAADKEFKKLAENDLGEPSRATPAVSGGRMYLRTYSHLYSVGGKAS